MWNPSVGHLADISGRAKYALRTIALLVRSRAPISVIARYLQSLLHKIAHFSAYKSKSLEVSRSMAAIGVFSVDWFSAKAPYWLKIFETQNFHHQFINALEIGSWEGMSACFLLSNLRNASLIAVDTWEGSDEHVGMKSVQTIEEIFDSNAAKFGNRVRKYKGTSASFFSEYKGEEQFNFIYVDGSHCADDVVCDAINAWRLLSRGGVIIFDDYIWEFYPKTRDNPVTAINAFLYMKKGEYEILDVYEQLCLKKS
ncbi:MAG: class I SAM-dependent methyltransferase [Bradyrhizobiaceae bacterium]|nr:class I SAM-dependent methyltransferase [Bradyrhizobiaceae bacterium]